MAIVIIDETSEEGRELLKLLQDKDYVEILDDELTTGQNCVSEPPLSYAREGTKKREIPLQMTLEELHESVDKAYRQYQNGEVITHEEFLKRHEKWL